MTNQNAALRRQMIGSLTEDDLRGLCFDYFPNLYDELTTSMTMSRMVELLLNWCAKNGRFQDLRIGLHRINPNAFPHETPQKIAPQEQTTDPIIPIFSRAAKPIKKVKIELRQSQEKVQRMLSLHWLVLTVLLTTITFLGVILFALLTNNLIRTPLTFAADTFLTKLMQGQPIPTLAVAQQTPLTQALTKETKQPPLDPVLFDVWLRPQDDMLMVFVPGGELNLQHVLGFWQDQNEVTNAQYGRCVSAGSCEESALAQITGYNHPTFPVVGVSWYAANAYCGWVGGQLPTDLQWKHAAQGLENSTYPWGEDEPTCELAQYNDCEISLTSVGSKPKGQSWTGVYDLVGNVWEWVQVDPLQQETTLTDNPLQPLRGGGWNADPSQLQSNIRKLEPPHNWSDHLGFRCIYPEESPK